MHKPSRQQSVILILLTLALALFLAACQQPGSPEAPTESPAAPPAQPSPPAAEAPAATTTPADDGFQEVGEDVGKVILPPEAPAGATFSDRASTTLGDEDATLTMYEWCDYAYPNCTTFYNDTLPELTSRFVDQGKLRIVHKEFPVTSGDLSVLASMAALCAARQDRYDAMAEWLHANADTLRQQTDVNGAKSVLKQAGEAIGIPDQDAFNTCIDQDETLEEVKADYLEAADLDFRELPSFVVGGHLIREGATTEELVTIIDALLQREETGALPDTVVTVTPSPTPDTDFEEETVTVMGDPNAPITIVEFSDYQCPFCLRHFQQTMPQLKKEYIDTGKVRYVFKDFPLSFHQQAVPASLAAECAGEQGKYWEMHDKLFESRDEWNENPEVDEIMKRLAQEIGLDMDQFNACYDSQKYYDEIMADMQEGIAAGVQGTPAFFINGQFLSGAQPYEVFKQILDQMLAENQ
jgi:protein-disulfide isomerase